MDWELIVAICAMLITLFVCIANIVSAYYAKQSFIEDNKAYISFFFDGYYIESFEKVLVFKNFGKSEGKILNIEYNEDLPNYIDEFFKQMENRTIMPGQKISCWINKDDYNRNLNIRYKYATLKQQYNYSIELDLSKSSKELYKPVQNSTYESLPNDLINVLKRIYTQL
ncbi:hypothetical protein [Mammaliicoccus sciuri]|uniref:hypothetical protein n=1 Tax=Mammaliicoccus sciuri TaxID=1296 RepID=UPI0018B07C29|nr:hypothetical protein [Mammaliicoccus sciuri]MBF9297928.1 hypothetical protein [Staphylococcus schleiferi]MBN4908555.1 hypothetical protein [Staphylococcus sp. EG-SA-13]MCJ0942297.1 hypothetical protein [Mammaliicoccus sciuri]MDO0947736.1 hypothetical protein [Mammaliicoccus sciuri]MDO0953777.1 hypothetical protein [Mammaliicoccus sciuri]